MTVENRPSASATDSAMALAKQIPADQFEVLPEPLGWRCRTCNATVSSESAVVARLAEAAADHGLYCGRCDD